MKICLIGVLTASAKFGHGPAMCRDCLYEGSLIGLCTLRGYCGAGPPGFLVNLLATA